MEDHIPFDIQAQIIQRLPIKSLIRFNSVSKPWKSLIRSTKFIVDYHVIQSSRMQNRILVKYGDRKDDNGDKYVSIIDDDTFPEHKFSLTVPISVKKLTGPTLLRSSQGLFCFYNWYNSQYVLWNPTIKKSVAIDLPTNELYKSIDLPTNELYKSHKSATAIGFGVCPNTLDTKLVKITSKCGMLVQRDNIVIQVEVYTLTSQVWRILAFNLPRKSLLFSSSVDVDGFIYWLAWDTVSRSSLIISFDLTSEVFTEVYCRDDSHLSLSKLGESLVVLEKNIDNGDMRVLIMKSGDPKSFTHIYTIDIPNAEILYVHGFRKTGEPIIEIKKDKKENEIIVYEPNTKQICYTGIVGEFCSFFASSYIETLLLLDQEDNDNAAECGAYKRQRLELAQNQIGAVYDCNKLEDTYRIIIQF